MGSGKSCHRLNEIGQYNGQPSNWTGFSCRYLVQYVLDDPFDATLSIALPKPKLGKQNDWEKPI